MTASMGKYVKQVLSDTEKAKKLTAAIIENSYNSDVIKVKDVLSNGKVLTLTRISIKDK